MTPDYEVFELGEVMLQSGAKLPDARLAYKTYGTLNACGDNVIVMPTFYTGTHARNEGYLRAVPALDSVALLHRVDQHVRQRSVVLPEQHRTALRRPEVPRCHPLRQRGVPATGCSPRRSV